MEINNLGFVNMDDYRLSAMTGVSAPQANFEEVLRRTTMGSSSESSGLEGRRFMNLDSQIDKNDKLYEMCIELETFLVKNLLSSMRSTVQKSGLIDEGFAGKMYEDMLYDEYAKDITRNSGFGLAEQAYLQLSALRGS